MTPEKVKQVASEYREMLSHVTAKRLSSFLVPHQASDILPRLVDQHLAWMCEEIPRLVDAGRIEKAMRWLGWLQGVMWVSGYETLEDAKRRNMPVDEAFNHDA